MPQDVIVVHANETPPETWAGAVFLAGPLPRAKNADSWHPEAIRLLEEQWRGDGTLVVFSPEPRGGLEADYEGQIAWGFNRSATERGAGGGVGAVSPGWSWVGLHAYQRCRGERVPGVACRRGGAVG